jgi:hypothetical protein
MRTADVRTVVLTVAFVTLLPALAAAQARGGGQAAPPVSLAGTWTFTVTTDAGGGTPTVTLTQRGDSLSGSYASETFGQQTLKGAVNSREFTLQFTADMAGQALTVVYKGTIESATSLKGTVSFGALGGGTFTAVKRPAPIFLRE